VHKQQSMIIVPADEPGVTVVRHLLVFGFDHAPRSLRGAFGRRARAGLQYSARRRARL
jgi:hypothetical protein